MNPPPKSDIESRADCDRLVRAFYEKAMVDEMIGFIFVDVAKLDLDEHLPKIAAFWETVLLGGQSYEGRPFAKHAALDSKTRLRSAHFTRWLGLWKETVDELFEGEVADEAKRHADRVAAAFQSRLADLRAEPPSTGFELPTATLHGSD